MSTHFLHFHLGRGICVVSTWMEPLGNYYYYYFCGLVYIDPEPWSTPILRGESKMALDSQFWTATTYYQRQNVSWQTARMPMSHFCVPVLSSPDLPPLPPFSQSTSAARSPQG